MDKSIIDPLLFRTSEIKAPRRIVFGLNSLERLCDEANLLIDPTETLIITDDVISKMGIVDKAYKKLEDGGYKASVFNKVEPEPKLETIEAVIDFARSKGFELVIGIGGGSVMDTAKIVSASLTNLGDIRRYIGPYLIKRRGAPIICIPTTSGTGSEVTLYAIVTIGTTKKACVSPHIIPDTALVDPMLSMTMPPSLTAGSGMDALSHAVESLLSTESTPFTDALAYLAIKLIFKYLKRAYQDPKDIEARYYMAYASTIAGIPLCNAKVVVGHSISQTFAAIHKVPHGVSTGMTLPYIMKFYAPLSAAKLAQMSKEIGLNVDGLSDMEAATQAIEKTKELADEVGIPKSLKDVGVLKESLPSMARDSIRNWPRPNSPIELNENNVLEVFNWMWEEKL
ncbi:MAG: iron-containing alcohol dehydrogenase [Nitrososphaeria archaeon]